MNDAERDDLMAALAAVTKERDEALAILADANMEGAWEAREVRRFGERLLDCEGRSGFGGSYADFDCCSERDDNAPGLHSRACVFATLLRDMLGAEETRRQVDAAHIAAGEWDRERTAAMERRAARQTSADQTQTARFDAAAMNRAFQSAYNAPLPEYLR